MSMPLSWKLSAVSGLRLLTEIVDLGSGILPLETGWFSGHPNSPYVCIVNQVNAQYLSWNMPIQWNFISLRPSSRLCNILLSDVGKAEALHLDRVDFSPGI
jgi:hypothetical protein